MRQPLAYLMSEGAMTSACGPRVPRHGRSKSDFSFTGTDSGSIFVDSGGDAALSVSCRAMTENFPDIKEIGREDLRTIWR